jgi:hypothetical protein
MVAPRCERFDEPYRERGHKSIDDRTEPSGWDPNA